MVLSSFSSTFAPVSAEAKRADVPLLYMGSVCPKEVSPPADPNQFCTTAYMLGYDSRAALDFIKQSAQGTGADRICRDGSAAFARGA